MSTHREQGETPSLRSLRKMKVFFSRQSITVISYYKSTRNERAHFTGTAHVFSLQNFSICTVALAHSTHSPPKEDEKQKDDIANQEEIEVKPIGIGAQLITI